MIRTTLHSTLLLVVTIACTAQISVAQDKPDGAQEANPTGTWKWERSFRDNQMDYTLKLTRNDQGKIAGTYAVKRNGEAIEPIEISDPQFEGNKLTFHVERTRNDRTFTIHYEGVVSDNGIKGRTKANFGGQERDSEWLAKREASSTKESPSWISLFDGKTLEGWERVGNEKSLWVVEDGALTASGPASMLVSTTGPYKNFRYRAEVKISDGGNSGLYFRTTRKPGFSDGYEAQIDSTHTDPIRTGSLYGMCHVYKQHVKPDTWFVYDIEVRDDVWRGRKMTRIKIGIDGNELYEHLDFELTFKAGHFAFQHHDPGSKVSIRKVEVMPLAD